MKMNELAKGSFEGRKCLGSLSGVSVRVRILLTRTLEMLVTHFDNMSGSHLQRPCKGTPLAIFKLV